MSEGTEDQLFELMAAARAVQQSAEAAVAALRAENAGQAERSGAQEAAMRRMEAAAARLEGVPERIGGALARTVDGAVERSARTGIAEQREATSAATREALAEGVQTLDAAAERAARSADRLGWRRTVATAAVGAAMVVATVGVAYAVDWWQGERIGEQRATIARLTPEVERLERLSAELSQLAEASEAFIFGSCGRETDLLCVRVNEGRRATNDPDAPAGSAVFVVWGGEPSR